MRIHERIREYIDSNGLKMNYVADKAGIDRKRFYRLVNGNSLMSVDVYEIICIEGLSVDPGYFFKNKFLETKNLTNSA